MHRQILSFNDNGDKWYIKIHNDICNNIAMTYIYIYKYIYVTRTYIYNPSIQPRRGCLVINWMVSFRYVWYHLSLYYFLTC